MTIKVGINGFGRIGRPVFKIIKEKYGDDIEIALINDLTDSETLAHLLKYDSTYGIYNGEVEAHDGCIVVDKNKIVISAESNPESIKWREFGVDIVVECTGKFIKKKDVLAHLKGGAKKVVISSPGIDEDITIVMGVNEDKYNPLKHNVISNASCTTNCLAPIVKVLHDAFVIKKGFITTIHSYTNDQRILDLPHKDLRRARSAALSIIPTSTGAARAVALTIPEMTGRLNGLAMRVPTPAVSVVDFVATIEKKANAEEVNKILKDASEGKYKGIIEYCTKPLVSVDFKGNSHSSIIDSMSTMSLDDDMIKVVSWYDNEWGYSNRLVDLVKYIGDKEL